MSHGQNPDLRVMNDVGQVVRKDTQIDPSIAAGSQSRHVGIDRDLSKVQIDLVAKAPPQS